jgi:hypothetical protein
VNSQNHEVIIIDQVHEHKKLDIIQTIKNVDYLNSEYFPGQFDNPMGHDFWMLHYLIDSLINFN